MVAILGRVGALRNDLILELLSSAASHQNVLFLHSRLHFPVERFKELTGGDESRLARVRLLYLPNFSFQERMISVSETLMSKDNLRLLFFDSPVDNYMDSLSVNWNMSSALRRVHSSFVKQLATLKEMCLEQGIGVLFTLDSNENRMTVQKYAIDIWSDLVIAIEQIEPRRGRLYMRAKYPDERDEVHDITIKKEGPSIE